MGLVKFTGGLGRNWSHLLQKWVEFVKLSAYVGGIVQTFFPGQLGMVKPSAGAGGIGPDCLQDCTKKKKKQQSSAHI